MNKKALHNLTYGLFVLTTNLYKDNGCIINTAMQISSSPDRICIAVNKSNLSHDMVKASGNFNLSIISEDADFELFRRFGFSSGRNCDKFSGFSDYATAENDITYITKGTNAYISAKVISYQDIGSHTLFIADITDMEIISNTPSASYSYYHSNIKPAPSSTSEKNKTVWRCSVCGYEYTGDELPEDFICPICKHPASDFEKR
jgi:flavin reductase (DIM6/NTAB) family NADH-FMN oxidoreductase RutF